MPFQTSDQQRQCQLHMQDFALGFTHFDTFCDKKYTLLVLCFIKHVQTFVYQKTATKKDDHNFICFNVVLGYNCCFEKNLSSLTVR